MMKTVRVGNTVYEIEDKGQTMLRITRRNTEGETHFFLPRELVLAYAREHIVRGFVRMIEQGSAD